MKGLAADLRHAFRLYLKTPLASAVTVSVLAIAMAYASAILSLWSDLALKPLAGFEDSAELVTIGQTDGARFSPLSLRLVEAIDAEATSIATIAGVGASTQYLGRDGQDPVETEAVTRHFFDGVRPQLELGRGFDEQDHRPGAEPVVVLSYDFWVRRFDGLAEALGQTLEIHGPNEIVVTPQGRADASEVSQAYRIVGVMSPEVGGTFDIGVDFWMPYEQWAPAMFGTASDVSGRSRLLGIARRAGGASDAAIERELDSRYDRSEALGVDPNHRFRAMRGAVSDIDVQRDALNQINLLRASSAMVALVAASTVSLFLLSWAPSRRRELATRMAVGAPARRLARQLVTEAALLVATATLAGLLASIWLVELVRDLPFLQQASWNSVSPLDWRVLSLLVASMLLLTALVSTAPIAGLRRVGIAASGRTAATRAGWGQRLAGGLQLAVAGALAGAALTFGWHMRALILPDHGFDPTDIYIISALPEGVSVAGVGEEPFLLARERRREVISALPGVEAVSFGSIVPGRSVVPLLLNAAPAGEPDRRVLSPFLLIDPDYFDLLGVRLLRGRTAGPDRYSVVVNETLAIGLWGHTDVVGEIIGQPNPPFYDGQIVVGVVEDAAFGNPAERTEPMVFRIGARPADLLIVRGRLPMAELRGLLEDAIRRGELALNLGEVAPLHDLWSRQLMADRARTWLAALSAALVVVLAAFGLYGMQSYLVMVGRREYAIRAAIGAGPSALGRLVLARATTLAAPAVLLGVALAFVAAGVLRGDYVSAQVEPAAVAIVVGLGMLGLVFVASVGPARQARRLSPAPVLREE